MTASRSRRTSDQWYALVDQQRASGLSVAAFARREGLVYQTFIGWCRRRRSEDTDAVATNTTAVAARAPAALPGFIELGIGGVGPSDTSVHAATEPVPGAAPEWLVELDLGAGMMLRVRRGR